MQSRKNCLESYHFMAQRGMNHRKAILNRNKGNEEKIIELNEAIALLNESAHQDVLTGLPNRRRWIQEIIEVYARVLRHEETNSRKKALDSIVVVYFDLNDFKGINDDYSHQEGDTVLMKLGERLKNATRKGEMIGRIGGDEFAMIVQNDDPKHIHGLSQRLTELIQQPIKTDNNTHLLQTSIGIAIDPTEEEITAFILRNSDTNTQLWRADKAMYEAKKCKSDGNSHTCISFRNSQQEVVYKNI